MLKKLFKKKETLIDPDTILPSAQIEFQGEEGAKFAVSNFGSVWGSFDEIDGYHFFESRIISHKNIKTFKGATLTVAPINEESFVLPSAMQELESDPIDHVEAYLTRISFDVTPQQKNVLEQRAYKTLTVQYKKQTLVFRGPLK